ncbi:hypothetical protein [Aneurinibacillus tyrosinisolvens]|uniref:hypothetical protein n=1 Tax=Aneurinibacillus tyrosinisolvens TaxID=1443435 RepID=UPI00063EFEB9|nr:hypothetical protein [Aneurinibacillus tyrosinisolvens]
MKRLQSFTLQTRIIIFALTIVSLLVIGMGIFFYFTISKTIEEKIAARWSASLRGLSQAQERRSLPFSPIC